MSTLYDILNDYVTVNTEKIHLQNYQHNYYDASDFFEFFFFYSCSKFSLGTVQSIKSKLSVNFIHCKLNLNFSYEITREALQLI